MTGGFAFLAYPGGVSVIGREDIRCQTGRKRFRKGPCTGNRESRDIYADL